MIFDSAAVEAGALAAADDDVVDGTAEGEAAGGALAAALEVAGPLAGVGMPASVVAPAAVEDVAVVVAGGAALPFPAVELLHPVNNNAAAARQANIAGRVGDLLDMQVTLPMRPQYYRHFGESAG